MHESKPRYTCAACAARGKTWTGDDPKCAFDNEHRVFHPNNWSCATLDLMRDLCYEGQPALPFGVDYQYCEDQKYASINVDQVHVDDHHLGLCLWLTWYKSRGSTDQMWLLSPTRTLPNSPFPEGAPRPPTEEEVLAIAAYYDGMREQNNLKKD